MTSEHLESSQLESNYQASEMADRPLISIVTPVRNGAPYLRDLIDSVLRQDYPNIEHIIIDDGSDDADATVEILKSYPHLRWWSRENKGQYATQNEAIAAATGDFLVMISADDMFVTPDAFSKVIEYWEANRDCTVIFGKTLRMDKNGRPLAKLGINFKVPLGLSKHYLHVLHCSMFVRRDFLLQNDLWFDLSFKYKGDWDWIVRLLNASEQADFLNEWLSVFRMRADSMSRSGKRTEMRAEAREVLNRYGGSKGLYLLVGTSIIIRDSMLLAFDALRKNRVRGLVHYVWNRISSELARKHT